MENRPMLGIKRAMIERTRRRVANDPQMKMKNWLENLQNPFSSAINFVCMRAQLRRLQAMEIQRTVVASRPRNFWSKIV